MKIRAASQTDWNDLILIYNHAVDDKFCTADTSHITLENELSWLNLHSENSYPIYVVEEEGIVVGWCSLSPYRAGRQALRAVAEISYYIHKDHRGKGLATNLISHALTQAAFLGFKDLIAILLELNKPSIYILEKFQFERWGYLPDVAHFANVSCGQFIYGRKVY